MIGMIEQAATRANTAVQRRMNGKLALRVFADSRVGIDPPTKFVDAVIEPSH